MTQPSIRTELAAAIRAVNSEFARLPQKVQDELDLSTDDRDRELDLALLADDRPRALGAIASWRAYHLALIRKVAR